MSQNRRDMETCQLKAMWYPGLDTGKESSFCEKTGENKKIWNLVNSFKKMHP